MSNAEPHPHLSAKLLSGHTLDLSDGLCGQLLQGLVDALSADLPPSFLSDHRVLAIPGPGAPAGLLLGDLIRQEPVTDHQVAFGDVEAFLGHAGGDQEVELIPAEVADRVRLLVLRKERRKIKLRKDRTQTKSHMKLWQDSAHKPVSCYRCRCQPR